MADLDVLAHDAAHLHEGQHALRSVYPGQLAAFAGCEVTEAFQVHDAKLVDGTERGAPLFMGFSSGPSGYEKPGTVAGFPVGHTGLEPVTSALSRQRSEPAELMTLC